MRSTTTRSSSPASARRPAAARAPRRMASTESDTVPPPAPEPTNRHDRAAERSFPGGPKRPSGHWAMCRA